MPRTRKTEPDVVVSSAAAAPARRKSAPRKPLSTATMAPAAAVESVVVRRSPEPEEIAALAYSYWVERGYRDGSPEQDWLRAEQELLLAAE
jgi:hypothetical protein